MTSSFLRGSFDRNVDEPSDPLDWCLAHSLSNQIKKKRSNKKTTPAQQKQHPPLDLTFWGKSRTELQAVLECRNEVEKQVSRDCDCFKRSYRQSWASDAATVESRRPR